VRPHAEDQDILSLPPLSQIVTEVRARIRQLRCIIIPPILINGPINGPKHGTPELGKAGGVTQSLGPAGVGLAFNKIVERVLN